MFHRKRSDIERYFFNFILQILSAKPNSLSPALLVVVEELQISVKKSHVKPRLILRYCLTRKGHMLNKKLISKLKVGLLPSKKNCFICVNESPLKKNEKCFLFHLKSSFRSQGI